MANLDEIFAAMPEPTAAGDYEALYIDPATRQIDVPDAEAIFGVESDGQTARKHFLVPRYVGDGLDLAACFLRVNFRNANSEVDAYLVDDLAISGEYVTFSWELSRKVTQYKGTVQFIVCAIMPGSNNTYPEWNTTLARGEVLEGLEPDGAAAEAATADVIAQLLALVAAQSGNVEAVGAAQVKAVQTEGSAQVGAVNAAAAQAEADALAQIEAKKQNVLADLPADYTAMGNQVDKLTRNTAGAIVCQAEGETIQVHNSSDNYLQGLRIFGRSTQDGTPTPDAPVEIVSVGKPTVKVMGKNLFDVAAFVDNAKNNGINTAIQSAENGLQVGLASYLENYTKINFGFIPGKQYSIAFNSSWSTATDDSARFRVMFNYADGTSNYLIVKYVDGAKPYCLASERGKDVVEIAIGTWASAGVCVLRDINLVEGAYGTETMPKYEQCNPQTLNLANDLPGIPVASGGNYTDANGQQWICDEVDLGRGVYVQRVGQMTLTNDRTYYHNTDTSGKEFFYTADNNNAKAWETRMYCSHFPVVGGGVSMESDYWTQFSGFGGIRFRHKDITSLDELAAWLQENPVTVWYVLANPVETTLDDVTLAAFRELHTNKPTTTLLNDAGAWMAAEYVADTKLYIDQKLEALVAANIT